MRAPRRRPGRNGGVNISRQAPCRSPSGGVRSLAELRSFQERASPTGWCQPGRHQPAVSLIHDPTEIQRVPPLSRRDRTLTVAVFGEAAKPEKMVVSVRPSREVLRLTRAMDGWQPTGFQPPRPFPAAFRPDHHGFDERLHRVDAPSLPGAQASDSMADRESHKACGVAKGGTHAREQRSSRVAAGGGCHAKFVT